MAINFADMLLVPRKQNMLLLDTLKSYDSDIEMNILCSRLGFFCLHAKTRRVLCH